MRVIFLDMDLPFARDWSPTLAALPTFKPSETAPSATPPAPAWGPQTAPPAFTPPAAPAPPPPQSWGVGAPIVRAPELPEDIRQGTSELTAEQVAGTQPIDPVRLTADSLLQQLPPSERVLRVTFVHEYLYDYDPFSAAIRCGYSGVADEGGISDARIMSERLMREPVVQRLLKHMATTTDAVCSRDQVIGAFLREATDRLNSTAQTRLIAIRAIAEMEGYMEKKKKRGEVLDPDKEVNPAPKGGVLVLPPPAADIDAWASEAMVSQKRLKDDSRA